MFKLLPIIVSLALAGGATVATHPSLEIESDYPASQVTAQSAVEADVQTDTSADVQVDEDANVEVQSEAEAQAQVDANADVFMQIFH